MKRFLLILLLVVFLLGGCDSIGVDIGVNMEAEIETTSELGPDTLARIDAVNRTLATGMEIGPETRQVIRELNETIRQGVKAGFDEATLKRVDTLLRVVEDGVKIGLDEDTLNTLNGMVDTIDRMPGNWETAATDIIRTLERSGGTLAGRMADEVKGVMHEARLNMQQMTAFAGTEFRCNVDFLGSKAGATLQEFIGHSIVGRLRRILAGGTAQEPVPTPWVCQVIPERVDLVRVGDRMIFEMGILTLTGYNYTDANSPRAYIVDEAGNPLPNLMLYPYRTSPYQIQLNLQGLDFSAIPPRSRIVFQWPNVPETSGVAILFPTEGAPIARFTFSPAGGNAPLIVQFTDTSEGAPSQWQWDFGDGSTSNERNPTHTFLESRSYTVQLTVSNALGSSSVSQVLSVGEQLVADFSYSTREGVAPMIVAFTDRSSGAPTAWEWDFGDGERSSEQNPSHVYMTPNPEGYTVTLRVSRDGQTATKTSPDRIHVYERLQADFTADPTMGQAPLTVTFRDASTGSNLVSWQWDFGDGTTSNQRHPTHTYSASNLYDVTLTVTNAMGETSTKTRRGYVNAYQIVRLPRPGFILPPLFSILQDIEAYTLNVTLADGTTKDLQVPTEKYDCGVMGMELRNGDIYEGGTGNILKAYLFRRYSAALGKEGWWLEVDFLTHESSPEWSVDILCLNNRSGNGGAYLYRDNFRGLEGGKKHNTGILTSEYSFCGIVGQRALMGDIDENGTHEVIWQARMDGSGPEWQIVVDFITQSSKPEERWDVEVLCLKKGAFLATDKPVFMTATYEHFSPPAFPTSISTSDYHCGVVGIAFQYGDVDENDTHPIVFTARASQGIGSTIFPKWVVNANFLTHGEDEYITADVLCVNRAYIKGGTPPP
ncbi:MULTISPECIES: PKD domain-containing protein [Anaerolinea]|uniref:PKD domain-containing protein n=1 Tax=Anaerolinea TaxID=233189 RepID=UPI002622FBC4|nr:PKD domain-containing protein [Anaerolinea thermophila]